MARPFSPLSLGRRMRDMHSLSMLCLFGAGFVLSGVLATGVDHLGFHDVMAAWVRLLVLLAALATAGWGVRLLLQEPSHTVVRSAKPVWVACGVSLGIFAVLAVIPQWMGADRDGATVWLSIAVNLLFSITLFVLSIDVSRLALREPAADAAPISSVATRSKASAFVVVAVVAGGAAVLASILASVAWVREFALPVWMLLCCAKAWLLTRGLAGRSSRWPVLAMASAIAGIALVELLVPHDAEWAHWLAQLAWCYALSVMALVFVMTSLRHTLAGWAAANPVHLQAMDWLEEAPIAMARVDAQGKIVHANHTQLEWLGLSQLNGQHWTETLMPALRGQAQGWVARLQAGESLAFEQTLQGEQGLRHVQTNILPAQGPQVDHVFVMLSHDISVQKQMAGRVQEQQSQLSTLVSAIPDIVVLKSAAGQYLHCNQAFERLIGLDHTQIIGKTAQELVPVERWQQELDSDKQACASTAPVVFEETLKFADGGYAGRFETTKSAIRDVNGMLTGVLCISRDVNERRNARKEIERLEFFDVLTGLPNRRMLMDRLQWSIRDCRQRASFAALLFIDLDNFKDLNDSLGHQQGDRLLCEVGKRLLASVRSGDVVARFGGDEFVILVEHLGAVREQAESHVRAVVEHLIGRFHQPFALAGGAYYSTPSIGVTVFGDEEEHTAEELLKRVDMAMYEAKSAGRNTQRFFDPKMQAVVNARAHLESDLRHAIQEGELRVFYQPVMNGSGRLMGAEALVRWSHPSRGLIPPIEFIDLAEQTGLILDLGKFVMQTACLQLVTWSGNPSTEQLTIAVNVSPRQFRNKGFVDEVLGILDQTGANAARLKLELTENLLLGDVNETVHRMRELKERGVGFSLDDFGVGYSSLSYLKRLPLDQLKIDRSFVNDVLHDANDAVIVRTILALAHSLELEVVAEGVENSGQLDFLITNGCSRFQGYHFGRPVPIAEFELQHGFAACGAI